MLVHGALRLIGGVGVAYPVRSFVCWSISNNQASDAIASLSSLACSRGDDYMRGPATLSLAPSRAKVCRVQWGVVTT